MILEIFLLGSNDVDSTGFQHHLVRVYNKRKGGVTGLSRSDKSKPLESFKILGDSLADIIYM